MLDVIVDVCIKALPWSRFEWPVTRNRSRFDAMHLIFPQFIGGDKTCSDVGVVADQALGVVQRGRLI